MAAPSEDLSALFGPAEAPAEEPAEDAFGTAFLDFIAAYEADDLESAKLAFKQAVQACYAEETAAESMPPE